MTDTAFTEQAKAFIDAIPSEDDAYTVLHALERKFRWEGSVFSLTEDVLPLLNERMNEKFGRDATEDEIATFAAAWGWRKGMQELMCERGWEVISDVISDIMHTTES